MKILWIYAKDFKCYDELQIPTEGIFQDGIIFVEGENSSGKSSLFDAIFYSFFYEPTTSKELGNKDDLIKRGKSKTSVEVAFELEGRCYLIKREHGRKDPVNAYLFEIDKSLALKGEQDPSPHLLNEGVPDVQNKLDSLLRITREKALKTLIVRQGAVEELAEARGADLRNIIYELFQLDYYREKAIAIVREKIKFYEEEKKRNKIERETENIEQEIEVTKNHIEELKSKIQQAEQTIDNLELELQKFPALEELQELSSYSNKLDGIKETLRGKESSLQKLAKEFSLPYPFEKKDIKKKLEELNFQLSKQEKEQEKIREELKKLRGRKAHLEHEKEIFIKRKESLEGISIEKGEKPKCEVCQQEIDEKKYNELLRISRENIPKFDAALIKNRKEIKEKEEEEKKATKVYNDILQEITSVQNITNDIDELEKTKDSIEELKIKVAEKLGQYNVSSLSELAKDFGLKNFDDFYSHVTNLEKQKLQEEGNKRHLLSLIAEKKQAITSLKKQIKDNEKKEKEIERINKQISLIQDIQKYVEGFIAEDIISNRMLASIQKSTSQYIFHFTRGKYSELYLKPTKQKTLHMSIKDEELGFVKSQNLLSGGDKAAIGLGLRIGISELLKRIRPLKTSPYNSPKLDILILDEPLGSLDEERRTRVIEGLVAEKKFSQIFLITHTNIRKRYRSPLISIQSTKTGSKATYYPETTEIEEEAEE
ncbi:MAG: AAA family ATPase [Candidatus Heimdallarchaeaceae archaeon]